MPQGSLIPKSLQHKLLRSLNASLEELISRGLVTSGEVIARLLPQLTSQIKSTGIGDTHLRLLYTQVYKAFRCRRSLLLLSLEKQVQLEELPWIKAIDGYRQAHLSNKILAKETLAETCVLTLGAFPQAILPNKLLQELTALAKTAELHLPLTQELAADIFMGAFSNKFVEAVEQASSTMSQSLYASYYGIDYVDVDMLLKLEPQDQYGKSFFKRLSNGHQKTKNSNLLSICEVRAGVKYGNYKVAENGMLLEQAQILSTHNLAVLFNALNLKTMLNEHLFNMVKTCFTWVCKRLQTPFTGAHAGLLCIKQSAYAWRQMVFFLSFLSAKEQEAFFEWASEYLHAQKPLLQTYFAPVLTGLIQASEGKTPPHKVSRIKTPRVFLAWSSNHWLLDMWKES